MSKVPSFTFVWEENLWKFGNSDKLWPDGTSDVKSIWNSSISIQWTTLSSFNAPFQQPVSVQVSIKFDSMVNEGSAIDHMILNAAFACEEEGNHPIWTIYFLKFLFLFLWTTFLSARSSFCHTAVRMHDGIERSQCWLDSVSWIVLKISRASTTLWTFNQPTILENQWSSLDTILV